MARLQYKICTSGDPDAGGYQDVLVFVRQLDADQTAAPWRCLVVKRNYVDPVCPTHGRRLKALLRSLA